MFGIEEPHYILCVPEITAGATGPGVQSLFHVHLFPPPSSRVPACWLHFSYIQAAGTAPVQQRAGKQKALYPNKAMGLLGLQLWSQGLFCLLGKSQLSLGNSLLNQAGP